MNRKCFNPFTKVHPNNAHSQNIISFCGTLSPRPLTGFVRPSEKRWESPLRYMRQKGSFSSHSATAATDCNAPDWSVLHYGLHCPSCKKIRPCDAAFRQNSL